ncbi:ACT domain-containing protein [Dioszegia hungarica]|uniref:ACT domain-containing protein n=1 Tax=Dioszegia hungarica TaxID=4972 RepID=A0AA38H0D4_9TREE|nr:ACT domain-containing protein [Dioszegia hungarica]KAI9632462.1 ACT domain-containing protein [Dioszegia hungarica]
MSTTPDVTVQETGINKSDPSLQLIVSPFVAFLAQFPRDVVVPSILFYRNNYPLLSVVQSQGETTIVCALSPHPEYHRGASRAETGIPGILECFAVQPTSQGGPYAVLSVKGPLDLTLTGILNELTTPLRLAKVPIYAISTWNTDYILVPSEKLDRAVEVLKKTGWTFAD